MTGPNDPGEPPSDDWGFPDVDPASTLLPPPVEDDEEPGHDTGSDAWWRAQAEAQRRAAATEPAVAPAPPPPAPPLAPPELVEPTVLNAPSPLDEEWTPELEDEGAGEQHGADWQPGHVEASAAAPMPVEAPAPAADGPPPRPREPYDDDQRVGPARALAGAGLALVGVLLAIGALLLFNGKDEPTGGPVVVSAGPSPSPLPTATTGPAPTAAVTVAPVVPATGPAATTAPQQAPVVPVTVLNNSRRTGFAKQAAERFRAGGWPVPTTGNYRGLISDTTVYYAPGQEASARRFARQFHVPRVLPRSALPGLPSTGMTVVLTRDYQL